MIGYYVHHQGRGHLTRASSIAAQLPLPVVGLSSLPAPTDGPFADWVSLAADDEAAASDSADLDVTAGGTVHWAPRRDPGLRDRMGAVADWVRRCRPAAVVVDVSVEVAVFVRLLGVPVVVVALPGDRADEAHQLAYRLADAVLAFWPAAVYQPPWLMPHAPRTHYVGALSRFDDRGRSGGPAGEAGGGPVRPTGVLLCGTGGEAVTAEQYAALPADHDWRWLGAAGDDPAGVTAAATAWVDDPWPVLCAADVVVSHAGQNALAEIAAAGRPAVIVPQARPHHEQVRTGAALAAAGIARVSPDWPTAERWPAELAAAAALGGDGWTRWRPGDAAARAAAVIESVAFDGGRR